MNNDKLYIEDVFAAIAKIQSYTASGRKSFTESLMIEDSVIRNLEIIREAQGGLPC